MGNKNPIAPVTRTPPAYVFNGLARWKYICVPTDVRGCQSRVIHRLPLFLISILLFQGKKDMPK